MSIGNIDVGVFQRYLAQAQTQEAKETKKPLDQRGDPMSLGIVLGSEVGKDQKVKPVLLTRDIKVAKSTESNSQLRHRLAELLTDGLSEDHNVGDRTAAEEIRKLLLGDEDAKAEDDLTGVDIYNAFRLLEDRKVSKAAAKTLAQGGLKSKLEAELKALRFDKKDDETDLDAALNNLSGVVENFKQTHPKNDEIWKMLELNPDEDVVAQLKKAFKKVHDLMTKGNCSGGLNAHLKDSVDGIGLENAINILSGASGLLGEMLSNKNASKMDADQQNLIMVIQENAELYALRLERVIADLTERDMTVNRPVLNKAIVAEFGTAEMPEDTVNDLTKAFEDISRDLSDLERYEALEAAEKESGRPEGFVGDLYAKVDNLIGKLNALSHEWKGNPPERLRELKEFATSAQKTLGKYRDNIGRVDQKSYYAQGTGNHSQEIKFHSATAVKEAFLSRLDVGAYAKLYDDEKYQQEMIDFLVSEDSVHRSKKLGSGKFNTAEMHTILFGDGKMVKYVTKSRNADNEGVERSPYTRAGISKDLDMARSNYASWKAGKVVLGSNAIVKTKISGIGGKQDGDFGILMEVGEGITFSDMLSGLFVVKPEDFKDDLKLTGVLGNRKSVDYWRCIGTMLKSTNELDWTDWLTAQGDRNGGNIMISKSPDNVITVKGIDNDLCFPTDRPTMGKLRLDGNGLVESLRKYPPDKSYTTFDCKTIPVTDVLTPIKDGKVVENYKEGESEVDWFELDLSIPPGRKLTEREIQLLNLKANLAGLTSVRRPSFITSGQLKMLGDREAELNEWKRMLAERNGRPLDSEAIDAFARTHPDSICAKFAAILGDVRQIECMYSRAEEMLDYAKKLEKAGLVLDESWLDEKNFTIAKKDGSRKLKESFELKDFFEKVRQRMFDEVRRLSPKGKDAQVRKFMDTSYLLLEYEAALRTRKTKRR